MNATLYVTLTNKIADAAEGAEKDALKAAFNAQVDLSVAKLDAEIAKLEAQKAAELASKFTIA